MDRQGLPTMTHGCLDGLTEGHAARKVGEADAGPATSRWIRDPYRIGLCSSDFPACPHSGEQHGVELPDPACCAYSPVVGRRTRAILRSASNLSVPSTGTSTGASPKRQSTPLALASAVAPVQMPETGNQAVTGSSPSWPGPLPVPSGREAVEPPTQGLWTGREAELAHVEPDPEEDELPRLNAVLPTATAASTLTVINAKLTRFDGTRTSMRRGPSSPFKRPSHA